MKKYNLLTLLSVKHLMTSTKTSLNIQTFRNIKTLAIALLCCLSFFSLCYADDTKVLIIGSDHDLGDKYGSDSAAFSPTAIASELQSILTQNGPGNATVTVEERYSGPYPSGFEYSGATFQSRCYNLTGWFHYPLPAGAEEARWANLRGESGTVWDYVVIIGDPYTMEKTPGMYAQGVAKVAEKREKMIEPGHGQTSAGNGRITTIKGQSYKFFGERIAGRVLPRPRDRAIPPISKGSRKCLS